MIFHSQIENVGITRTHRKYKALPKFSTSFMDNADPS